MKSFCLFLMFLFATSPAYGESADREIRNCNGRWTNLPCQGQVQAKFKEKPVRERSAEAIERDKRELVINELNTLRFKARKDHGVVVGVIEIEQLCLDLKTSLRECGDAVSKKEEQINNLVIASIEAEAKRKDAKEKNDKEEAKNITVIHQRSRRSGVYHEYVNNHGYEHHGHHDTSNHVAGIHGSVGIGVHLSSSNSKPHITSDTPVGTAPPEQSAKPTTPKGGGRGATFSFGATQPPSGFPR